MSKFNKNTKIIAAAVVMAVIAGSLALASAHNAKQTAAKKTKPSSATRTITTKNGKKITVPASNQTPEQRAKASQDRLQKRLDAAVKQKRLTEAQVKLIQDKYASMAKIKSEDTKARAAVQKDLYVWAKENKIPLSFVFELSRPRA